MLMMPVIPVGPKGVIHDWRKFKLESEDHESTPPTRREILRQMSNPKANNDDNDERINRKVFNTLISQNHKRLYPEYQIIFSIPLLPCIMTQWSILTTLQNCTIKLKQFSMTTFLCS